METNKNLVTGEIEDFHQRGMGRNVLLTKLTDKASMMSTLI